MLEYKDKTDARKSVVILAFMDVRVAAKIANDIVSTVDDSKDWSKAQKQ